MNDHARAKELVDRLLGGLGLLALIVQGAIVVSFAVDIPYMDDWTVYRPGQLSSSFDPAWLARPHNEHRMLLTKLQLWSAYRIDGLDYVLQIAFNYAFYAGLCVLAVAGVQRIAGVRCRFLLLPFASTLPCENHSWAFQSQIHFFIAAFFGAVLLATRTDRWRHCAPVLAVLGTLSFGGGVVCGLAWVALAVLYAIVRPAQRRGLLVSALVVLVACAGFLVDRQPPGSGEGSATLATTFAFFLDVVSTGFAYGASSPVPGLLLLSFIAVVLASTARAARTATARAREVDAALVCLVLGLIGVLAAVALGRAPGPFTLAKTSRYAEIGLFTIPPLWALTSNALDRAFGPRSTAAHAVVLAALAAPFHVAFDHVAVYEELRQPRLLGAGCIAQVLDGERPPHCPDVYPLPFGPLLDRARELDVRFVRTLSTR